MKQSSRHNNVILQQQQKKKDIFFLLCFASGFFSQFQTTGTTAAERILDYQTAKKYDRIIIYLGKNEMIFLQPVQSLSIYETTKYQKTKKQNKKAF